MPITGPTSYLQTADEFGNHWGAANTALGASGPLILSDGTELVDFLPLRGVLDAARAFLQGQLNGEEIAREDLSLKRILIQGRLLQFGEKVRAFFGTTKWAKALPELPTTADSPNRFLEPLDDIANLWERINADPATNGPITLLGGYTRAMFVTDVTAFKAGHKALTVASSNVRIARVERNVVQDQLYANMKAYREVFPTFFAKTHPLTQTLPRLTPERGSTPSNVAATAVWVPAQQKARITWTESTDANLDHYEVRFCPGPSYSTDDESVVASIDPGEPRELLTDVGLTTPGAVASFKVYVVTTTGNESGSNAVTVTRPSE